MKSVVICGSRRYTKEIRDLAVKLRQAGATVYEPYLHNNQKGWSSLTEEYKRFVALGLTHDHLYKIRMADVIYVLNKDKYSGVSTTMEIGMALALGKPIYAYETDDEYCRLTLFREIIKTPRELLKKLR